MRNSLLLFSLLFVLFSACKKEDPIVAVAASQIQILNSDWDMRQTDTDNWMPIPSIPSTVHTALLDNKAIEDPFYRNNEEALQWIETKDWEYRKRFDVNPAILKEETVELQFKGLDTYADVFLNGQKILEADNMFRSWLVDVKTLLKLENNELRVHFHTPINKENEKWAKLGYELPDGSRRAVTRKAGFHYGWDWGPRFVTMGLSQGVELRGWSKALINEVHYRTFPKEDKAEIQAFFDVDVVTAGDATIAVQIDGKTFRKKISLQAGNNKDSLSFTLNDIKLWWPNGLGEQHLYDLTAIISSPIFSDKKEDRIGIRTIELKQPVNNDGVGFFFEVNGLPVFAKGANYIPQDIFQERVTDEQYKKLLGDAKLANMNMLRVWGGGIYEKDIFYETCDELGLLVWQDFMFANTMIPGDDAFRKNVAEEAKEQVSRLANHPCIALWCGNNEVSEGWHRWGWQANLDEDQKKKIWADYKVVFNKILPEAVTQTAPLTPYWESSPQYGRGDANHVYVGDAHYWGVWHDAEPFEVFKTKVPRFMSEYGFQSLPSMQTIESFTLPEDRNMESEVMKVHQKHSRGTKLIKEYMARAYKTPKDFDNFAYVSQLLQADGIRMGMEAHLRRMPYCMGTLYWQFNDCWPVASWSSIDNQGNWKALHYAAQSTFEPIHILIDLTDNRISPMLINHTPDTAKVLVEITVMDFQGTVTFNKFRSVDVIPFHSKIIPGAMKGQMVKEKDPGEVVVIIDIYNLDSTLISSNQIYMVKPKDLKLTKPNIKKTVTPIAGGLKIRLETDVLAKSVYLEHDTGGFFTDNFFDLFPGRVKVVELKLGDVQKKNFSTNDLDGLRVRSLVDSY